MITGIDRSVVSRRPATPWRHHQQPFPDGSEKRGHLTSFLHADEGKFKPADLPERFDG
jgi:hypothetical protein